MSEIDPLERRHRKLARRTRELVRARAEEL